MNKLIALGTFLSTTSIYLTFFDTVPFGVPWGIVCGVLAFFCYREVIKERFNL